MYTPLTQLRRPTANTPVRHIGLKKETVKDYHSFLQCFNPYLKQLHFAKDNDVTPGKMKLEKVLSEAIFSKT